MSLVDSVCSWNDKDSNTWFHYFETTWHRWGPCVSSKSCTVQNQWLFSLSIYGLSLCNHLQTEMIKIFLLILTAQWQWQWQCLNCDLEQRLEPEGHVATTRILPHWKCRVLELNIWKFRLSWVEWTKLQQVKLKYKNIFS